MSGSHDTPTLRSLREPGATSWPPGAWDRMWRPTMWLRRPPSPHEIHLWHIVAILALTGYANVVANQILSPWWHIPFNLGILGVAVAIAHHAGLTIPDVGYRRDRIKRGVIVGAVVMGIVAAGVAIGVAIPSTRRFFTDGRVAAGTTAFLLFEIFVRIPIATAFYEETLFRGIIFGMLARRRSPLVAATATSLLFGLWHILPTMHMLGSSRIGSVVGGRPGMMLAAAGAVASTAVAGFVFLWLRLRANSTVAPVLAHIATNSFGLIAAMIASRLSG